MILLYILPLSSRSQISIDSLKHVLYITDNDTLKLSCAGNLTEAYLETQPDSSVVYAEMQLAYARKLGYRLNESYALGHLGYALMNLGNYPRSLAVLLEGITIAEDPESEKKILPDRYLYAEDLYATEPSPRYKRLDKLARNQQYVGILYGNASNYEKEKEHHLIARNLAMETGNLVIQTLTNATLGRAYLYLKMPDSALISIQKSYEQAQQIRYTKYLGSVLLNLARIYSATNNPTKATEYFRKALEASNEHGYQRGVVAASLALSDHYLKIRNMDSAYYFMNQGQAMAQILNAPSLLLRSYTMQAEYYRIAGKSDSIVNYQNKIIKINDSLFSAKQAQLFQNIDFDVHQKQQQKEAAEKARANLLRLYGLLAGLTLFLIAAIILWRNNQHKQRAYALLEKQKAETDQQREKVEQALTELRSAQTQLVQAEKMASLGELTAGIAHEIQNPLNFINNFSEINIELISEIKEELSKGNYSIIEKIADDLGDNEAKITRHGKRADAIVKGMLEHSRTSSGTKEPADLNALADEYLRLAFHGMRARDKFFNAHLETDLDTSVGQVNMIAQDIGRVLLNLFNNAFIAVSEKKKLIPDYEPVITLETLRKNGNAIITVRDNGSGIATKIKDKIFQPFFTTREPGQGTGLGLSLSYDIIKTHGGEITVKSEAGEGAEFTVVLPANL